MKIILPGILISIFFFIKKESLNLFPLTRIRYAEIKKKGKRTHFIEQREETPKTKPPKG